MSKAKKIWFILRHLFKINATAKHSFLIANEILSLEVTPTTPSWQVVFVQPSDKNWIFLEVIFFPRVTTACCVYYFYEFS